MANLLPIHSVQPEDTLNAVRRAMRHGLDAGALDDFLASIDWSGAHRERPRIAALLGEMEGWADQFARGDLTQAQYVGHLLSLLPAEEQERRLVLGGGPVVITIPAVQEVADPVSLRPARSSPQPQTGSGAPHQSVQVEAESRTCLAV